MRLLRVVPAAQTALDLGPAMAADGSAGSVAERGWWRLPESARAEVIVLLARLIARGVLVEDPPTGASTGEPTGGSPPAATAGPFRSGSGEGRG